MNKVKEIFMKLYHGSTINIEDDYLKPNLSFKTFGYEPSVYFTTRYELALMYAINPIRAYIKKNNIKGSANAFSSYFKFNRKKNKIILYECYEGMLNEIYNNLAYIYVVNKDNIEEQNLDETGCKFSKPVKYDKKLTIRNVLDELLKLEKNRIIEIIRYKELTERDRYYLFDSIGSRANSCEHEAEILFFQEKFADNYEVFHQIKLNKTI